MPRLHEQPQITMNTNVNEETLYTPSTPPPSSASIHAIMAALSTHAVTARRAKQGPLQTLFLPTIPAASTVPTEALSVSSVASSSQQPSPVMSPQSTQTTTNNSSSQGSPEGPRGREA